VPNASVFQPVSDADRDVAVWLAMSLQFDDDLKKMITAFDAAKADAGTAYMVEPGPLSYACLCC
jgi:hypothetical protein